MSRQTNERLKLTWFFLEDKDPEPVEIVYTHTYHEGVDEICLTEVKGSVAAATDVEWTLIDQADAPIDQIDPMTKDVVKQMVIHARGCEEIDIQTVVITTGSSESVPGPAGQCGLSHNRRRQWQRKTT